MHTKTLAVLKRQLSIILCIKTLKSKILTRRFLYYFVNLQLIRKKVVKSAKECIKKQGSKSELYGKMQVVFIEMDAAPTNRESSEMVGKGGSTQHERGDFRGQIGGC